MSNAKASLMLLARLSGSWLIGCAIAAVVVWAGWSALSAADAAWIAIASGGISFVALLPVGNVRPQATVGQPAEDDLRPFVAFTIGMGIRIIGTVALFLVCRYQMDAPPGEIAAMVLGWYVYLTIVETTLIVRGARARSDAVAATPFEN